MRKSSFLLAAVVSVVAFWIGVDERRVDAFQGSAPSIYVQKLIDSTKLVETTKKPVVRIHMEPGPNGQYEAIAAQNINDALNWFAALGMPLPQSHIDYVFGRTSVWLNSKIEEVAPGCIAVARAWQPDWQAVGSAALCSSAVRGGAYSHIVNSIVPDRCCNTPDNLSVGIDLAPYLNAPLSREKWHGWAHETFHIWQGINNGRVAFPQWMLEGGAQLFTYMLWAKLQGSSDAWLALDAEDLWGPRGLCNKPISNPGRAGCNYSQGMVAMEYFIYKFGINGYINLWTRAESPDLKVEFPRILGTQFQSFEVELEQYLADKGWGPTQDPDWKRREVPPPTSTKQSGRVFEVNLAPSLRPSMLYWPNYSVYLYTSNVPRQRSFESKGEINNWYPFQGPNDRTWNSSQTLDAESEATVFVIPREILDVSKSQLKVSVPELWSQACFTTVIWELDKSSSKVSKFWQINPGGRFFHQSFVWSTSKCLNVTQDVPGQTLQTTTTAPSTTTSTSTTSAPRSTTSSVATRNLSGTRCKTPGAVRRTSDIRYVCTKVGRGLVWKQLR